ncbi:hypothetical protein Golax_008923, partial [Gossypium laxum]|nr:hypothetical protein [Gossypium laxum]
CEILYALFGFRDLRLFNISLLGKQVWWLINNNDTLCYRVLCSKYFTDGDVLYPKAIDKPSFSRASILHAVNALETEWGFEGIDSNSFRIPFRRIRNGFVSELWRSNSCVEDRDQMAGYNLLLTNFKMASVFHAVLSFGGLDRRLLHSPFESGIDWLEDAEQARTLGDDFRVNSLLHAPINPRPLKSHRWIKPLNEAIKINVDAAIFDSVVGIGIIVIYHNGFVLRGCAIFLDHKMDIEWAKAEALTEGII